ncbi:MAG: hypothetical protein FJY35_10135 [Betaproteobacteria bacterium]|nr:hypothetical protein [Betaproteobacteria bacterium]
MSNGSVDAILPGMRIFGISAALRPSAALLVLAMAMAAPLPLAADSSADYVAEKEFWLRSGLAAIAEERSMVRSAFTAREQQCLQRFASAACLEDARQANARAMRELDLAQEMLNLEIRQLHADARQRARQQAMARHLESLVPKQSAQ